MAFGFAFSPFAVPFPLQQNQRERERGPRSTGQGCQVLVNNATYPHPTQKVSQPVNLKTVNNASYSISGASGFKSKPIPFHLHLLIGPMT